MKLTEKQAFNKAINIAKYLKDNYFNWIDIKLFAIATVSIIKVESTFDTQATNPHSTAKGLMQITNPTKKELETKILKLKEAPLSKMFDADYNMFLGMGYLAYQMERYDINLKKGVIAYNQGHFNTSSAGLFYYDKFAGFFGKTNAEFLNYAVIIREDFSETLYI